MMRFAFAIVVAAGMILALWPRGTSIAQEQPVENVAATYCNQPGTSAASPVVEFVVPGRDSLTLPAPEEIWIDISTMNTNFATGTFVGSGSLEVKHSGYIFRWPDIAPYLTHHYRLNARYGSQWRELSRGIFTPPDCYSTLMLACIESVSRRPDVRWIVSISSPGILEHGGQPIETWLDLSLQPGFARGAFIGAGPFAVEPLPFGQRDFHWDGLLPARWHHWRTNTRFSVLGWVPQRGGSFYTPNCTALPPHTRPPAID